MPSLNGCTVGKPAPKAGETRTVFCNGFTFKQITTAKGSITLLEGSFVDEDGKNFTRSFGSSTSINLDEMNNLLESLNKPLIDEHSISSLFLPDTGSVPADWAAGITAHFIPDAKNTQYTRIGSFSR